MDIQLKIPSPNDPATEAPHKTCGPLNRPSMMQVDRDDFIRELAAETGAQAQMIRPVVRAHVAARMSAEEGTTPEGRSRILGETRELVWDGILDAVKQVPCPSAPPPRETARPPRRSQPGRGR